MRVIWAFAVVCLMAAAGVAPAHGAAAPRAYVGHAAPASGADRLAALDRHPALPAVAAARPSALVVATRHAAASLPVAVLAAPPALPTLVRRAIALAPHRALTPGSTAAPTRSARGPPAR